VFEDVRGHVFVLEDGGEEGTTVSFGVCDDAVFGVGDSSERSYHL
jgi:hypothetical protein